MLPESKLTVRFERLGIEESNRIISWSIDSDFLVSTDGFEFSMLPGDLSVFRDLELEPVELLVPGRLLASQVKGRIDVSDIGDDGSAVTYSGRDYLADLVESNIDPGFVVKGEETLGQVILQACEPCGILVVEGDDEVGLQNVRTGINIRTRKRRSKKALKVQEYTPRPGEGTYEFCNRLAARHGATMQPSTERTVVTLTTPDYVQEPAGRIHITASQPRGVRNNVISAKARRDWSRFATYTLARGKQAARSDEKPVAAVKTYDMVTLAANLAPEMRRILTREKIASGRQKPGNATLNAPQLYRLLHIEDDEARTEEQLEFAALRAIAERLKDTLEYTVTLQGHTDPDTGAIWSVNTMIDVTDEIRGVDEPLWVAGRKLSFSKSSGAIAQLKLWRPGSFQIDRKE